MLIAKAECGLVRGVKLEGRAERSGSSFTSPVCK